MHIHRCLLNATVNLTALDNRRELVGVPRTGAATTRGMRTGVAVTAGDTPIAPSSGPYWGMVGRSPGDLAEVFQRDFLCIDVVLVGSAHDVLCFCFMGDGPNG